MLPLPSVVSAVNRFRLMFSGLERRRPFEEPRICDEIGYALSVIMLAQSVVTDAARVSFVSAVNVGCDGRNSS